MKRSETHTNFDSGLNLSDCTICPRNCRANRFSDVKGYCQAGTGFEISSICRHQGEEPVLSGEYGVCNVFFSRCNLQCVYCQNCQISTNDPAVKMPVLSLQETLDRICNLLDNGCRAVGFVSPSHMVPQVIQIINALKGMGRHPVFIYNTNAYDKVEVLQLLEGLIDVYLPDFKYSDETLAIKWSDAKNYVKVASAALKEMFRQKGTSLVTDENDLAISGIIIRHMVIPGHVENSLGVLRFIAGELSPRTHISLMSQYHPMPGVSNDPDLGRAVWESEYLQVKDEMLQLGLNRGWVQDFCSSSFYLPDFNNEHPFEIGLNNLTN